MTRFIPIEIWFELPSTLGTYVRKCRERVKEAINFKTLAHSTSLQISSFIIAVLSSEILREISCRKRDKCSIDAIIKPSRIVPRYESSKKMLFVLAGSSLQTKYQFSDNRGIVQGSPWNPPFEHQRRNREGGSRRILLPFTQCKIRIRSYSSTWAYIVRVLSIRFIQFCGNRLIEGFRNWRLFPVF